MSSNIVAISGSVSAQIQNEWSRERIELVKRMFCKGATDDELALFVGTCKKLGLSPEARQIFAMKRWDNKDKREVMSIQVSVDGLRLAAERNGRYDGQTPAEWCGENGDWMDVWFSSAYPMAARVGVYIKGISKPLYAAAHWAEYVQTTKDGEPTAMWKKMPRLMLAKCAESLALRKAFPQDLSGIYTQEEMQQAVKSNVENAQLEKLINAFESLYEKKTGKKHLSIIYLIEDICGGKKLNEIDELDLKALRSLHSDLLSDKTNFQELTASLYPPKSKAPEIIDGAIENMANQKADDELSGL